VLFGMHRNGNVKGVALMDGSTSSISMDTAVDTSLVELLLMLMQLSL